VLIVDDEQDIRELLALLLRDLGFAPITAPDGEQALSLFRVRAATAASPIILTDIKMPGLDGIGLLRAVKEIDPDTEVIMISGHGDMQLAILSLKHGAADFITKPIDDGLLEHALNRARERLGLKRQVREHTENLERLVREKSARLVELERRLAARQIVEGFSSAMRFVSGEVDGLNGEDGGEGGDSEALGQAPCFVSLHAGDLTVLTANALYRERLCSGGEPEGLASWAAYGEAYPGGAGCPVERALTTGHPQQRREVLVAPDGTRIPALISATPLIGGEQTGAQTGAQTGGQDGAKPLVLEIAVDLSELERLRAELSASNRRFRDLFNAVPCSITVQDRDLRLVQANKTFLERFGAALGSHCYEAYKHSSEPCPDCPILRTFEDGRSHQAETVVTDSQGAAHNIVIWTAPLKGPDGVIQQVMEVSTDITQLRQLQDHVSSLGIMLGSMSHGVKGLLMGLDGGMYRVESGLHKGDLDRIKNGWATVRHRVERIRKMVLDILYYAKSRELDMAEHGVLSIAEELAGIVESKALAAGIAFERQFMATEVMFQADHTALCSALLNFLENAVDACLGDVPGKKHHLRFGASVEADRVLFRIEDTGLGMDRETREKMFTLFFSSKGSKGTGIGLFISSTVIRQHHGTIAVESSPGDGTTFLISLPLRQPACPARQGAEQAP
jgi:signal transduction histidine kinase/FixJ family two-component response regulator